MLTRLRVRGFKNLRDVEVWFGPFTCIAGVNGSGKSNLFDAITFLADLSQMNIIEAAARVREPNGKGDYLDIFSKTPAGAVEKLEFDADFLVSKTATDDFNKEAEPVTTFLNYKLLLRRIPESTNSFGGIQLGFEQLAYIPKRELAQKIRFADKIFIDSAYKGPGKRTVNFISTSVRDGADAVLTLHTDGGNSGKGLPVAASRSPKTLVAGTATASHPTVLAAKREMGTWRLLQFEPSAMRESDTLTAAPSVDSLGGHIPATLNRLGEVAQVNVANSLSRLIPDIRRVQVNRDLERRLWTLYATDSFSVRHSARALSDGTLRFLALATIQQDTEAGGVLCLEEPENGIHPGKIADILSLIKSLCVNPREPISDVNPLRQVIINTHSPIVVEQLSTDELLLCKPMRSASGLNVAFKSFKDTWRPLPENDLSKNFTTKGEILDQLGKQLYADRHDYSGPAPRQIKEWVRWIQSELPLDSYDEIA